MPDGFNDSDTDKDFTMRLYAEKDSTSDSYYFCDLRETLYSKGTYNNVYNIVLTCAEIREDTVENSDIEI